MRDGLGRTLLGLIGDPSALDLARARGVNQPNALVRHVRNVPFGDCDIGRKSTNDAVIS